MTNTPKANDKYSASVFLRDAIAGTVVFLVALPLCLGIALASGAPPFAGILTGIVGGILVGILSGSHTSISGPAAGLTAIVADQIASLGSFEAFLTAVFLGGLIQIGLGIAKAGFIASFFPSSVIKGLLAAIGVILILKQLPYVLGHEAISIEEMAAVAGGHVQGRHENPIYSLRTLFSGTYHLGPLVIGIASVLILAVWDRVPKLKKSLVPPQLIVVIVGVLLVVLFGRLGSVWGVNSKQLVDVPVADGIAEFIGFLKLPDFTALLNPAIYLAGITIAVVATLESMLNLEAVDNLDTKQRVSPPNRELLAQGIGNVAAGLIGGLPMTSVVVRGSVNISAGAQTKASAVVHGCLLIGFALWFPRYLNMIPLSCLAAILIMTGVKLASPKIVKQLYKQGYLVFLPFAITVVAIVMTDLLIGIMIGLGVSLLFILSSNYRRPIRKIIEKHIGGDVHHIELANQVSFLSRAALEKSLRETPRGGHVLLDARNSNYIDPDVLSLINEFKEKTAPALGIHLSLRGFRQSYELHDDLRYVDYSTEELQQQITPQQVLQLLIDGNERFHSGNCLPRDLKRQVGAMAQEHYPMALILSCMDARTPTELLFDMGMGNLLNVCLAGNAMLGPRTLASIEYGCAVNGAKLIVVMGHSNSSVMDAAVASVCSTVNPKDYGEHFGYIVEEIRKSIDDQTKRRFASVTGQVRQEVVNEIARKHILRTVREIPLASRTIQSLLDSSAVAIIGAMYDTQTGKTEFMYASGIGPIAQSAQITESTNAHT